MYAVETHCLCELLNRYVIITKHAIVSALLFSQSEQKVKSGICTINHKTCTNWLRKKSLCVFNLCENYTTKYPMAQAVFVKTTQEKTPLYIYYIISTGADAACVFLAFCYDVGALDRVRATKERRTDENRMNRTQCAWRSCWQYCRRWRGGITPGKESIVKGMNKLKFVFRCAIVGAVIAAGLLLSALIR